MNTDKRFWIGLCIFFLIIGAICFFPYLFTSRSWFELDFSHTGEVGDTIGGIMGPFIAIAAAILTFLAFWVQYQANVQQRQQFVQQLEKQKVIDKAQEKVWRIERFENRFYELLRLHTANVDEMNIADKIKGRKCFVQMFYEFKYIYLKMHDLIQHAKTYKENPHNYEDVDELDFAYNIFFWGIGNNSEKTLKASFSSGELHLFQLLRLELAAIQDAFENLQKEKPNEKTYLLDTPLLGMATEKSLEISYYPFDGHVNRLAHYYRHLHQTVKYIIDQDEELLDYSAKYSYVKTLRAQLSNHEQLLLYYNAMAWFENRWYEAFTKYRLIKNLPLPLADFGIIPEEHFEREIKELRDQRIEMFEWPTKN